MRPWRGYGRGRLWRPLLDIARSELREYADAHGLRWIDDPGNDESACDRNFLRHAVMPLLRRRWPHATDSLAQSAALSAQAADLLGLEDAAALLRAMREPHTLDIFALQAIPRARRARVLRRWIEGLGLPPLPGNGIARIESDLLPARADAQARFEWAGSRVQRWRHVLHADGIREPLPQGWSQVWDGRSPLALPTGDHLELIGADGFDAPLRVHARQGGERLLLTGRAHHHSLRHVLQERNVPPWLRTRMPLLSDDGELLAAGDALLSARMASWLHARDACLRWSALA
jgi:tRNA(Ile)-lysidine synthase